MLEDMAVIAEPNIFVKAIFPPRGSTFLNRPPEATNILTRAETTLVALSPSCWEQSWPDVTVHGSGAQPVQGCG